MRRVYVEIQHVTGSTFVGCPYYVGNVPLGPSDCVWVRRHKTDQLSVAVKCPECSIRLTVPIISKAEVYTRRTNLAKQLVHALLWSTLLVYGSIAVASILLFLFSIGAAVALIGLPIIFLPTETYRTHSKEGEHIITVN